MIDRREIVVGTATCASQTRRNHCVKQIAPSANSLASCGNKRKVRVSSFRVKHFLCIASSGRN